MLYCLFVPQAVLRGLYNVVRSLPDHSVVEGEELAGTMTALLRKCLYNEQPLKVEGGGIRSPGHSCPTAPLTPSNHL